MATTRKPHRRKPKRASRAKPKPAEAPAPKRERTPAQKAALAKATAAAAAKAAERRKAKEAAGPPKPTLADRLPKGPLRTPDHAREYAALGKPPEDPLDRVVWINSVLSLRMHHVITDPKMDEEARGKEIVRLAKAIDSTVPKTRIRVAEEIILGDRATLEGKGDEELSDAAPLDRPACRGPNRRGRPRKGPKPGRSAH